MIGDVFGSYRVVARLGAGGMGTVWLAEHQLLGSTAAIKVLLPDMSANPKIVQRFFDEARAASRIQDPGIVRVLDFGWQDQRAYLVMEHLAGETLNDRISRVHLVPPMQAMRILQQCGIAMAAAHARGIVHRDLKPDNIFLVADAAVAGGERIKILDFGIAKLIDNGEPNHNRTQTGVIMGTPAFMSPEQCRAAGGIDHRTDIYALGCVLYMMLCGRPPFIAPTAGDMIASHLRQDPPVPSSLVPTLTPDLDALVLRCLEKDADRRFQSMTELVRAAAPITGENQSIETIAPMKPITQPSGGELPTRVAKVATGETVQTVTPNRAPPANTTLGHSNGEAVDAPRPWRGGFLVIGIAALAAIGVAGFVVTRDSAPRAAVAPSIDAPPIAMPASAPPVDAGVTADAPAVRVATPPAVRPAPGRPSTVRRPPPVTPQGPGTPPKPPPQVVTPPAGPGSGSGSGKPYDPFADR